MGREIELSIMAKSAGDIQPLLNQFEAEKNIKVKVRLMAWDTAWNSFMRMSQYGMGPDVSEVGSTWIGDLAGMEKLRPFSQTEASAFRGSYTFYPSIWKSTSLPGSLQIWGIPWLVGSRLLYYRKDLLEQAGVQIMDFRTNEGMEQAIVKMHRSGIRVPWVAPTGFTHTTLLHSASWVWAAGGDFLTTDGKAVRFMEPAALAGMKSYFSLGRYLAPEVRNLNGLEPDEHFLADPGAAMVVSGPWLFMEACRQELDRQIGIGLMPGPSFVGGSNLAVWKWSRYPEEAQELIHFLLRPESQVQYAQKVGLLPARQDVLNLEPYRSDSIWRIFIHALMIGRTFPAVKAWGMVEESLTTGFSAVWQEMKADLTQDPHKLLVKHLAPLAEKLNHALAQA